MTIFKYILIIANRQKVPFPIGAKILSVQVQYEKLCIWAQVDEFADVEEIIFRIYGTGGEVPLIEQKYIGTVQMNDGLVWHLFKEL